MTTASEGIVPYFTSLNQSGKSDISEDSPLPFDYGLLDSETRIVVQQEDQELDRHIGEAGNSFILACHNLQRIHEALKYKRPGFVDYCLSKPGLEKSTAYKMLDVAKMFPDSGNIFIKSKEALYLLASPSTPEIIRQEMINRAKNGETIIHSTVREAIGIHKTVDPIVAYSGVEQPQRTVDEYTQADRQEFDYDSHLDAALADEDKTACPNCGLVYDGESCPDCNPRDYNYKRDNRRSTPSDIYTPQGNDACQTPPYAIDPLLPYLPPDWVIWEPAAGEGYLVEALYDASRQVTSSDILDGRNFFEYEPDAWDCITTNPPFSILQQWLKHCYELGKPFALLIKVEALGTKGVQEQIEEYGFEMMLLDKRIDFKMPFLGWGDEERKSSAQFPVFWLCWQLLPEKVMFGKIDKRGFNGQSD